MESRVAFLEANILPPSKANGHYSKKEQDLIRSYVLLVHAEIEAYFEDIAASKVSKSLNNWITNRQRSACLQAVLAYAGNQLSYEGESKNNSNNISFRINRAVRHFNNLIQKNNGIKESNILAILVPLGIELTHIDPVWLSTMDAFGSFRGQIAHKSLTVQQQVDRNSEVTRINTQILPEIILLDERISRLI